MKKVIIILVVVVLLLVCGFFIFKAVSNNSVPNKEELENKATEIYNNNTDNVMEGTDALLEIEGYETMSIEERSVAVGQLLRLYEEQGKIRNLEFYKDENIYSFEYNGGVMDGVLGGISLNDYQDDIN